MRRRARPDPTRTTRVVDALVLPEAVWKTCPWQPRDAIETGLRQWLRCCGAAMADGQSIGMPSRAVDEAWHGLILCTQVYAAFCRQAYGRFLHHHPEGGGGVAADRGQLDRTVLAWHLVARPDEACVLWDLDTRLGLYEPWGVSCDTVSRVSAVAAARLRR